MADLNMEMRRKLLKKGQALPPKTPGGPPRFPISDADDVESAVHLVGQVPAAQQPMVRRHIIRNAKKVPGGMAKVPDNWQPNGQVGKSSSS
jgi:hypothetical protein